MSVDLKVSLGTVNYTDWLHVTASKVSTPSAIAWQDWIDVPVTNYNFIIPGLDPEIYFIRYYDAPTSSSLGSLVMELVVNALTGEWLYERRFYTVGGFIGDFPGPVDGDTQITDPYLIDKRVTGVFKEAFRYLEEFTEWTFDNTTGVISLVTGVLSDGEKMSVEIQYAVASTGASAPGLYNGSLDVVEATRTMLTAELNKRLRLLGTTTTQVLTLPALSSFSMDNGYYFDNSVGGLAVQVKILLPGIDKIKFNGFNTAGSIFTEFWISRGEHFLLRKQDDTYWEVITDYKGTNVGEKVTLGYDRHPNVLTENGQLIDGDEYPRLWWWIKNVLPSTHKYITDTVTGAFAPTQDRVGQFAVHSTLKKFRMPSTVNMTEKGLSDFSVYGIDTGNRTVDYPGGFQDHAILAHRHWIVNGFAPQNDGVMINGGNYANRAKNPSNNRAYEISGDNNEPSAGLTSATGASENRTRNIGVIYGRRI